MKASKKLLDGNADPYYPDHDVLNLKYGLYIYIHAVCKFSFTLFRSLYNVLPVYIANVLFS